MHLTATIFHHFSNKYCNLNYDKEALPQSLASKNKDDLYLLCQNNHLSSPYILLRVHLLCQGSTTLKFLQEAILLQTIQLAYSPARLCNNSPIKKVNLIPTPILSTGKFELTKTIFLNCNYHRQCCIAICTKPLVNDEICMTPLGISYGQK